MSWAAELPADWVRLRAQVPAEVEETLVRAAALGLLGPMELGQQIDHALGFVVACESHLGRAPATALDLGAGGGVPGLILGSCWPGCRLVLVDAGQRRAEFLVEALADGAPTGAVEVVRGRAEELARTPELRERFEVVTSRSFGPPAVAAECGSPFLTSGGLIVVSEPPGELGVERWPDEGLSALALESLGRVRVDRRYGYQLLGKVGSTPARYPRRTGIPTKRPLF